MKLLKIFLCSSSLVLSTSSLYADSYDDLVLDPQNAAADQQGDYADYDALLGDAPESLSRGPHGGGVGVGGVGGGWGRGGGWGFNPTRWSGGPRTWYNPFSWGNPPAPPIVAPAGPSNPPPDELDAQIDAANRRAKQLELLLAEQRRIKALEELNKLNPSTASPSSGGGSPQ